jgi:hypothetical protein
LTENERRLGIIREPIEAAVENQDTAPIAHEQTLVHMVEGEAGLRASGRVVAIDFGVAAAADDTLMSNDVVRSVPHVAAFFIELIDEHADVPRLGHEHAAIDAIQRHRSWSPNAVRVGTTVGDTASRRRVPPDVELHQDIARRLAVLLGEHRADCDQREYE